MCLYPRLIRNKKYLPNNKNGGTIPECKDQRTLYVPVGCGKCMECRKQRSRQWSVRLQEEIRTNKTGKFVTMTFSDESLIKLEKIVHKKQKEQYLELQIHTGKKIKYSKLTGYDLDNKIATLAVRQFLERWRKKFGTSVKHWLVTELGQNNTERLHIHGIIWTTIEKSDLEKIWKNGTVNRLDKDWSKNYVTERTINYIVKYVNKTDQLHKEYNPIILVSPGLGANYINRQDAKRNIFRNTDTKETYSTRQGTQLPLPIYYRNKIYTEDQKEKLWLNLLDKEKRYINGIEIDISQGYDDYDNVLKEQRLINNILGYGNPETTDENKRYEQDRRNLLRLTRIKNQK